MNMLKKFQELSQKAAQIKAAVDKAPETVQGLRRSLLLTAGQIQQVRTDLTEAASGLRVESEDDFAEVLLEINSNGQIFREAGYELTCLDLEVSKSHRLILEFDRIAAVPDLALKNLLATHNNGVATSSILQAFVKAEEVAAAAQVTGMHYTHLVVHVGAAPAMRLCWRADKLRLETPGTNSTATVAPVSPVAQDFRPEIAPAAVGSATFAASNYFETTSPATSAPEAPSQSSMARLTTPPLLPDPALVSPAPTQAKSLHARSPSIKSLGANWKEEAMQKLKAAPGESKYHH
jgi:hypothetical protein